MNDPPTKDFLRSAKFLAPRNLRMGFTLQWFLLLAKVTGGHQEKLNVSRSTSCILIYSSIPPYTIKFIIINPHGFHHSKGLT